MPRRAKGLTGPTQRVTVAVLVRATATEAELIRSAANEAGLSYSRYVIQAAVQRARSGSPSPAVAPSRLDRRTATLHRLKREADFGTEEHDALTWASAFCHMLRGGTMAPAPALDTSGVLSRLAVRYRHGRHNVIVGSLTWAARLAEWAYSISAGKALPNPVVGARYSSILSSLSAREPHSAVRWALRMSLFLDGSDGHPERAPYDAPEALRRLLEDPESRLSKGERSAIAWASRLVDLTG